MVIKKRQNVKEKKKKIDFKTFERQLSLPNHKNKKRIQNGNKSKIRLKNNISRLGSGT